MKDIKYTYEDFLEIIKTLRSENGCPWDREQTHESLKPCMMEEATELLSSIRIYNETGDYDNLVEELGDVLLQVVMHATIGEEEGLFTIEDVINEVATKMVRRHPHVFGNIEVSGSSEVLDNWDEIKKREKEGKTYMESPLREIPRELPSLTRMPKVLKKVDKLYKPQNTYYESIKKIEEETANLNKWNGENNQQEIEKSIGIILHATSNISRISKISQEQILWDSIEDLIAKYEPRDKIITESFNLLEKPMN